MRKQKEPIFSFGRPAAAGQGLSATDPSSGTMTTHALVARVAKLWKKRTITITEEDPKFKTVYLGNTVTQWAKGGFLSAFAVFKLHVYLIRYKS